ETLTGIPLPGEGTRRGGGDTVGHGRWDDQPWLVPEPPCGVLVFPAGGVCCAAFRAALRVAAPRAPMVASVRRNTSVEGNCGAMLSSCETATLNIVWNAATGPVS